MSIFTALTMIAIFAALLSDAVSPLATIEFIALAAIALSGMFKSIADQRPLFMLVFYFVLVFFVLAPMQQIIANWDYVMRDASIVDVSMGICLLFAIICLVALLTLPRSTPQTSVTIDRLARRSLMPLFLASMVSTFLLVSIRGTAVFASRTDVADGIGQLDTASSALLLGVLQPFSAFGAIMGLTHSIKGRSQGWAWLFAVALFATLIINNPTVTSRYQISTFIFALIFYGYGQRRCRALLAIVVMGTFSSIFFQIFRGADSAVDEWAISYGDFFVSMDYDAFALICHTVLHVQDVGIDWGASLLSSALFFIPRSIWASKSFPTPFYLLDTLKTARDLWSFNLSEPVMAEGYFGFGILGAAAISTVFAAGIRKLELTSQSSTDGPLYFFLCACPSLLFLLLRGTLIVACAAITAHLMACWLCFYITRVSARRTN